MVLVLMRGLAAASAAAAADGEADASAYLRWALRLEAMDECAAGPAGGGVAEAGWRR